MQHLLARAAWDTDAVASQLRDFVVEHLRATDAVLVVDETGDLKKGRHSVGVQRQYTGTAGRIENAQVAVYLTYSAKGGHALIDRELYLPRSWTDDLARCAAAGVPADRRSPSPSGEDLGSVTYEVQRQTRPSRRRRACTGQWESCLEHRDERPAGRPRGDRT
jgi:SRSO17 transposase